MQHECLQVWLGYWRLIQKFADGNNHGMPVSESDSEAARTGRTLAHAPFVHSGWEPAAEPLLGLLVQHAAHRIASLPLY